MAPKQQRPVEMAKKSRKNKTDKAPRQPEPVQITMQALEELSDSSSSSEMPPEDEWNEDAKKLKRAIESGKFNKLLQHTGDDDSIEEVELDGDSDSDGGGNEQPSSGEESMASEGTEPEEGWGNETQDNEYSVKHTAQKDSASNHEDAEAGESSASDKEDGSSASDDEEDEGKVENRNSMSSKALQVVTDALAAETKKLPWAETFDIVASVPLPFNLPPIDEGHVNIHDDLKREVAFYDVALEAVKEARAKCQEAKIPFSRPEDFFAEMIKTDGEYSFDCIANEESIHNRSKIPNSQKLDVFTDHMAKVKDRLIFENKKMEAVSQRKSNKEQKLRAKEAQSNKIAEKAKRKREHFRAVDEWAQSAASKRGRRLDEDDDVMLHNMGSKKGPNAKRLSADKKFGFGGKRGRFKQNDRKTLNDTSAFNPRGNFAGGMKRSRSTGGGATRKGKRARDATRASR